MTDNKAPVKSQEERQADLAPEMDNDEQDDHRSQAQEVAMQAKEHAQSAGATESLKVASDSVDGVAGSETDMVDQMREMEDSGRIDYGAFAGEPNHDDNTSKYDGKERA
ncbi:hypothetical protein [Erythrobacter ani]|uniref:Uncharacterized protein n=1 Tax=Erythrobacter ani TaxID=2827235 RepID=A0ABS6SLA9_9SPHN|nr:hypothetical protein [Erythrobacter ani]MBV7265818.1 hypothetical protein [Erythrobacter ani]